MKYPVKTLIFTMASMTLIACETPQKTESVVLINPMPGEQTKKPSQPVVKDRIKDSVKATSERERPVNTPAHLDRLVTSTIAKSKGTVGKIAEEQDASVHNDAASGDGGQGRRRKKTAAQIYVTRHV